MGETETGFASPQVKTALVAIHAYPILQTGAAPHASAFLSPSRLFQHLSSAPHIGSAHAATVASVVAVAATAATAAAVAAAAAAVAVAAAAAAAAVE